MITILMLGGAKRVSVARHLIEAFRREGRQARMLSYELDWRVPAVAVAEVIQGLRWNDPGLTEHLRDIVQSRHVNLVLPFVDPAVEICARLRQLCPDTFIPVSDEELCRTMFDKRMAQEYFAAAGIPQPEADPRGWPRIYKPRCGSASKGIFIARSQADIPDGTDTDRYLVQRYIADAREYTVDCYVRRDGQVLSVVPRQRLETAGGEAMRSITVADGGLDTLARKVLTAAPLRGPVTLQILRDTDNNDMLMEVNPRLGGGVVTSIGAGSQITSMIAQETLGLQPRPCDSWIPGTLMTRYSQELIFHPCK